DTEKKPTQPTIGSTGGEIGERSTDRTARDREKEQSHTLVHRRRFLRLHHAASHSAKHPRKSRLVHRLHAVSGRTRSGSSRSAAQFSNNDCRSYKARHRQCITPR